MRRSRKTRIQAGNLVDAVGMAPSGKIIAGRPYGSVDDLPAIVDKLIPEGKIPESTNLLEQGLNFLKGMQS